MIYLYPDQLALFNNVRHSFANHKSVLMQLETGGGKTYIFSFMAKKHVEKGGRVLILTDRIELMKQAGGSLENIGCDVELIEGGKRYITPSSDIYIGMVETVYKRLKLFEEWNFDKKISLVIIDECHKANFKKVISFFTNAKILGATATPVSSKKHILSDIYEEIVAGPTTQELINAGRLLPYTHYKAVSVNTSGLKLSRGEYDEKQQIELLDKKELHEGLHTALQSHKLGKTLIFCVNVEHSLHTAKELFDKGWAVKCLTSKNNKEERHEILSWFHNTVDGILVNCGILTTGYDHKPIQTIVIYRKTNSLALYRQMIGRGSRIADSKESFVVIDMANNYIELGRWDAEIDWRAVFWEGKNKSELKKAAPAKSCPNCMFVLHASAKVCSNCGHKFKENEKEVTQLAGLAVVEKPSIGLIEKERLQYKNPYHATLKELLLMQQIGKNGIPYSEKWLVSILKTRKNGLENYAKLKGYDSNWLRKQYF